jgi:hypothetical protein
MEERRKKTVNFVGSTPLLDVAPSTTAVLFLHFHDFLRFSYRHFYLLPL